MGTVAPVRDARESAERSGDDAVRIRCDITDAAADLLAGSVTARGRLLLHAAAALDRTLDEIGTTAYSNLSAIDVEHRRFRDAEEVLALSIPITVERDIPICNQWQTAMRARLHFQRARWAAALEDADEVLDGRGAPLASIWPHLVLGLVASRTGGPETYAARHLDAAWDLAEQLDEPLARLPVMSALAEQVWHTRADDPRLEGASVLLERVDSLPGVEWAVGDLLVWLARLGIWVDATSVAEPSGLELEGRHEEAARRWAGIGAPYERAIATVHGADDDAAARAMLDLEELGVSATAERCRGHLRERG